MPIVDHVTVGTLNLNFGRPSQAHAHDIRRAVTGRADVDVLAVQEVRADVARLAPGMRVAQGRQADLGPSSQAVLVHPSSGVKVRARGSRGAFRSRFGQQVDWRRHVWAVIDHPALGRTAVVSVHVPPRYMWRTPIEQLTAASLRRVVRRHQRAGRQVVVLGDFNYVPRRHGDRLGLKRVGLRQVAGDRIDQIWVTDGLDATGAHQFDQPGRRDDHPLVTVELARRDRATYSTRTYDRKGS